jgi:heme-degrading monooxygenase HmoA
MTTVTVMMSLDPERGDEVRRHFNEDIVPWARRQPGFLGGHWLRSTDGHHGLGVVRFASEKEAEAAAQGPRAYAPQPGRAWNVERVDVCTEIASA